MTSFCTLSHLPTVVESACNLDHPYITLLYAILVYFNRMNICLTGKGEVISPIRPVRSIIVDRFGMSRYPKKGQTWVDESGIDLTEFNTQ